MNGKKELRAIVIALLVSITVYFVALQYLEPIHAKLLGVVALLVVLWTNGGLPLGVVSLLPIVIFPFFGFLNTSQTASQYANGIIFLFLGGFMMAIAVEKTELHKIIARKMFKVFPATPKGVILALATTSGLLSSVLSNTTTALLLLPLANFLATESSLKMRFALSIAFGASIGGIITPIGTPPNLILLGFMELNNITPPSFVGWIALTAPLAVMMIFALSYILSIKTEGMTLAYKISEHLQITREQKRLSIILAILAFLLLFNSPIKPFYDGLGLDERSLILFFGLLMFMPRFGFLKWEESKSIPYEIIFLFGAGFALASAFAATGFDSTVASSMSHIASFSPVLAMFAVIAFMTLTGIVVSNTALASMALPIVYSLANDGGLNPELFLFVATVSASYAFILPISTPPNAIALSSGSVKVGQMAMYGVIMSFIGAILLVLIATLYWSWVL